MFTLRSTAPGNGKGYTFDVYKNGSATGMSVMISNTQTNGNDIATMVSFSAGDEFGIRVTRSGAGAVNWNGGIEAVVP